MHDDLKLETRDKVLQKMSRNGAVEQNVSRGTDRNISGRISEITFERMPAPGSDVEFGRGAKEETGRGGFGSPYRQHGSYSGSVEHSVDYEDRGFGGFYGDTQGGYFSGADSGSQSSMQGGLRGSEYSSNGFYGGTQDGIPYSDHEAYLDSLLKKAGVDTGSGTGGIMDSDSTHRSRNRKYRVDEGVTAESRRLQDYQMSGDSFDITGHRTAYEDTSEAFGADASEQTAGDETLFDQTGYDLSESGRSILQENRTGALRTDAGSRAGRSLVKKEAYKQRVKKASVRQNAVHEKPLAQKLSSERNKEDGTGAIKDLIHTGERSGAKKTMTAIREGQKAGPVLNPFSSAADKLSEEIPAAAHEKIHESEDDNSGVQAAHEAEIQAEHVIKTAGREAADAGKGAVSKGKGRLRFDDEGAADVYETVAGNSRRRYAANEIKSSGGDGAKMIEAGDAIDAKSGKRFHSENEAGTLKGSETTAAINKSADTGKKGIPDERGLSSGRDNKTGKLKFTSGRAENVSEIPMESGKKTSTALTAKKQSGGKLFFGEKPDTGDGRKAADLKKQIQKKQIKREYAAALKAGKKGTAGGAKASSKAAEAVKKGSGKLKDLLLKIIKKNYGVLIALLVAGLIYIMFLSASGTVASMFSEAGESFVGSTYLSADDDITENDAAYKDMEDELQDQIDSIEEDYPGYDEYRYQVDEISHDPYALASYFTAIYGNYKASDVEAELLPLFQEQYTLTLNEVVETRTRTVTDPDTGEESEEEYDWYVLEVTLTNAGVDTVAQAHMNDNQKMLYGAYMVTKGNRSYLFGGGAVPGNVAGGGLSYDIPPEALEDEAFARMIEEAEKYLGMEYVWGGSSPSSGFDCSGFVSWVINHSGNGWNVGRSTANGLMGHCTRVSSSEAKPGDLIFFEKTYNTSGASHVGIYVGDGMMIHCGNPIQYTSINSNYWQNHFLGFGRISD